MRSLFLTERTFRIGWVLVLLLVAAYFWPPLLKATLVALVALGLAVLVDIVLLYRVRNGIQAARHTFDKWSNGDENPVHVDVRSSYPIPLHVRVLDELPVQFQERGLDLHAPLPALGTHVFHYRVRPVTRGVYTYGAINVLVSSVLGLAQRRYRLEQGREIAVYPSYIHLRKYELMAMVDRWSATGARKVRRSIQRVEFERIRDYVAGDDKRAVNWKATARRTKMMVNQYQDEKAQQVISLIDLGRTMKMPFEGLSLLDRAINATLVLSDVALKKDDKAGVVTYSDKVHAVLPPSRNKGQLRKVLDLLYAQRTDHAETDFDTLFATVRRSLGQRSLLVIYTNFESLNAMRRQLPFLQRLSRAHLVTVVLFTNTELDDLRRLPDQDTIDVYVKTIANKFLYEKQLIQKELESHGILTILTRPQDLSLSVMNKYLEIKARAML